MTCVPPCPHQDYCAHYGCPFTREPQSSNLNPRARAFRLGKPSCRVTESCPPDRARDSFVSGQGQQRWHLFSSDGRDAAAAGDRITARRESGERTKAETLRAQPVRFSSCGGPSRRARQHGSHSGGLHTAQRPSLWRSALSPQEAQFSSGDGQGVHQPGSMTWGGHDVTPAPSGRARNRATCPAVTRFISASAETRGGVEGHAVSAALILGSSNPHFEPGLWATLALADARLRSAAGIEPGPRETNITSDASTPVPEAAVNPAAHLETPLAELALAKVTCRHRGEAKKPVNALPTHSRGPDRSMDFGGETSAALEAATDRIRRSCIGPLAQGNFPARLLPRGFIRIRRRAFPPLIFRSEGELRVSAACRAAEALLGAA